MFFESWFGLMRVIVVEPIAYAVLILVLRLSGKRTLAKLNAFDLVVTVALGSTLSTVLLSKSVALAEGVIAFMVLAGLQDVVAWLSVRSRRFGDLVKSEPTLLMRDGRFLREAMLEQRVTEAEVAAHDSTCGSTRGQRYVSGLRGRFHGRRLAGWRQGRYHRRKRWRSLCRDTGRISVQWRRPRYR